jgi:toxin ParE1/3/4
MRYRVSDNAARDLDEIFVYWANRASPEAADRVIDKITERFWLLGQHPDAGRRAGDIAPGVKCFPAGKYLIYYRKTRRGIDVLHIFHGARNQGSAFKAARKHG